MFSIGQEVECIRDDWGVNLFGQPPKSSPKVGDRLVITTISPPSKFSLYKEDHLGFAGHENEFTCSYFRPLLKKKTDISVFTEMLKKVPENVDV